MCPHAHPIKFMLSIAPLCMYMYMQDHKPFGVHNAVLIMEMPLCLYMYIMYN